MANPKKVVIIGGGFGGISAAKSLRKSGHHITIIDRSNHHLFQPLLYQVATAALSPGDIAVPIRAIFSKKSTIQTIMGEVTEIDRKCKTIRLKNGREFLFDYLVLAPGAQYNYFGKDHWEEFAPGLKTLNDALSIRERILLSLEEAEQIDNPVDREPYLTYVIIGGGPTGVEMAGAIAEIAKRSMMQDYKNLSPNETRVYLIEAASRILNGYPESLSERAREDLEKMGVRVLLNTPVTDIQKDGLHLGKGKIETPNIIWAAGVVASPLIGLLGVERDRQGRAKVNPDLSIQGSPDIFVIGDAAHLPDGKGQPLPALAPVAMQQGKYTGEIIRNQGPPEERKAFRYADKGSMATIGRAKAVAEIRGFRFSGFFAWVLWSVVHILFLIGFRNRFRVFAEWMWYYLTFRRGVRLITRNRN